VTIKYFFPQITEIRLYLEVLSIKSRLTVNIFILQDSGPYRNQDETVELAINLNVDPRRPGQALRGSLALPHGTGKTVSCLVFTSDLNIAKKAEEAGHKAGGVELIDRILEGTESLDAYQRAMATKDVLPQVQKQLARLLGPRGLMPNPKTNTIFDDGDALLKSLTEVANTITYRTDPSGILHFALGKGSFTSEQLLDNFQIICQTIQDIKPESYGKGKKKKSSGGGSGKKKTSKNVKYWLRAHLTATQAKGSVRMDLRSVDPTSPFFMKEPE
jgi:large subunit ribosomal protein L1